MAKESPSSVSRLHYLALGISAFFMSSCVLAVGNRGNERTLGRELSDLQQAHKTGAITSQEYRTQKSRLLNQKSE